jgi:CheY-like chemotaxis protein
MDVLKDVSVLLVEDEWLIALDAQEMLAQLGAQVTVAASLEEGAGAAMNDAFDVAVLDVNLNGQLSFTIGELLADRGTPVVYATGYNLKERPLEGYQGGHWLAKPYSRLGLQRALLNALGRDGDSATERSPARPNMDQHAT